MPQARSSALPRLQPRCPDHLPVPEAVESRGHQGVHEVVAACDPVEHLAHQQRPLFTRGQPVSGSSYPRSSSAASLILASDLSSPSSEMMSRRPARWGVHVCRETAPPGGDASCAVADHTARHGDEPRLVQTGYRLDGQRVRVVPDEDIVIGRPTSA